MKTVIALIALAMGFVLGGCADQPLMSDEEYNARHGPGPNSPDFTSKLPNPDSTSPTNR